VKTQIINIEPHDDAISVKDKMGWGQTPRILLVWPSREKVLQRRLDLVHIQRHSISLGSQLALVTGDRNVRRYAELLNIPVFPNIRKAEVSHWRPRRRRMASGAVNRKPTPEKAISKTKGRSSESLEDLRKLAFPEPIPWLNHPVMRLVFFTLGVAGVLAVAAVLLPSAEIKLNPDTRWQNVTIPITADPEIDDVQLSGSVPIRTISIIVEGRGETSSSGSLSIPDKKATGNVVFTNLTNKEISIPSGTVVSTVDDEVVRYATQKTVLVPAYSDSSPVEVEAINPGSSGNQRSNSIIAIEGPLGLDLTVINPSSISRGSEKVVPAPNDSDYIKLQADMLEILYDAALVELEDMLEENDILLKSDPADYMVIEEQYSPSEIQPGDDLFLTLQAEYKAVIVSAEDIYSISRTVLKANLPEGYEYFPSTIEITHLDQPESKSNDRYFWEVEAKCEIGAIIDNREAANMVLWLIPDEALKVLLEHLPIDQDVSIESFPRWWPRLPILPFRVIVNTSP